MVMAHIIQKTFNDFLESGLNDPQRNAVMQKDGALLIIAGAGSGKTRVITSRIANLIVNQNVEPRSIVALTFTNKAAGEMKERLMTTFDAHYGLPFIGTFHSYCLQILRTNPTLLPFQNFSIFDADDQLDLIKKISKKFALTKQATPTQIVSFISQYKNKIVALDDASSSGTWFPPYLKEIYLEYETEKAKSHCLDFDDLILSVLHILRTNQQFKDQFQKNIRHILIDEYQDTNVVQHQLLMNMGLDANKKLVLDSLCAVGDEDQSIYSWRGATVANMLKFQQDFAPVIVIKIEQNYRSVQPILEAANSVIANNRLRNPKNLWSTNQAKHRILSVSCQSGDQEASMIAQFVKSISFKKRLDHVAILYRTHFQSRTIEEALIHRAIPYRIVGGLRFYERKEIKDLLGYLRLIVNPFDKISLLRIINTPARGLGQKFEDQLIETWGKNPLLDFKQLITWMCNDEQSDITPSKKTTLHEFIGLYEQLDPSIKPSQLLDIILNTTQYTSHLAHAYDIQEAQTKSENIQELLQAILVFERKYLESAEQKPAQEMLQSFLHEVSLLQETMDDDNSHNFVQMMTLHAAKGLEFDIVILAGLNEGLLPSTRSLNTNEDLEEERRLMYVGMTRAKEHLLILNAWSRFTFGQIVEQPPSRFVDEIPKNLLTVIDLEKTSQFQAQAQFEQWLNGTRIVPASKEAFSTPSKVSGYKTKIPTRKTIDTAKKSGIWAKNQAVHHDTFGTGIVVEVEKAPEDDFYVTALFKLGKKKILGRFLKSL